MSDAEERTVRISRAQTLAAQLIEKLEDRLGTATSQSVKRVAQAGRDAGVNLPSDDGAVVTATGARVYRTTRPKANFGPDPSQAVQVRATSLPAAQPAQEATGPRRP